MICLANCGDRSKDYPILFFTIFLLGYLMYPFNWRNAIAFMVFVGYSFSNYVDHTVVFGMGANIRDTTMTVGLIRTRY